MARVLLRTAESSMFLPERTVFDASGLCKYSLKEPFYEAPFYYKTLILWYHKTDFLISQIRFFWYHKTDFLISQNNPDFLYHKLDLVISKNQDDFFDIKK